MGGRAFVLHPPRDPARRAVARDLLDRCGMPGDVWPAVDGRSLSSTELAGCVGAQLFAPAYPFALTPDEIGIFLSHRQIWAEILRRDLDFALVLSDGAAIDPGPYRHALALAQAHIDMLGYIQFRPGAAKGPVHLVDTAGGCVLCVPQAGERGSVAQLVSWEAADHLLHLTERFDRPVGAFVQSHWQSGLRAAAVYPSGVTETGATQGAANDGALRHAPLASLRRALSACHYRRQVRSAARRSPAPQQGGLLQTQRPESIL